MDSHSAASPKHRSHQKQSVATSESTQPWTATRCHRLLRPLLAHIAALRKDKERRALVGSTTTTASQTTKSVLRKRSYPADDSDYDDKKPCRKYSRKASRRASLAQHPSTPSTPQQNAQRQRRQPGNKARQDLVLPTPLLRRVRNHQPSTPGKTPEESRQEEPAQSNGRCQHPVGCGSSSRCTFEAELASLRFTIDAERRCLYESVIKAFDSLLRVTCPRKNQAASSKSLVAMCLRKVPAYIAALEEWERKDDQENGAKSTAAGAGVSFEVYSELESLGAVDGWRHLCLVVRAHGVQIIQDAASEGLLEDPVTDLLIRLCLEYMPPPEFMGLIETFVIRQYPKPRSAEDDLFAAPALRPLQVLRSCDPAGDSLLPGILAELLADGLLPADWILTKNFIALWPSTVRLLTEMKPCQDAADFIVMTLEHLCDLASPRRPRGVPQTRLRGKPQNTLISAVAALASMVLLSEEGSSDGAVESTADRAATLRRRIHYVVKTCSSKLKHRRKGGRQLGIYLLALCSFLSLGTDSAAAIIESSWKGVLNCRGNHNLMLQYDATTALMSAVAHHCSRGTGLAPNVYLSQLCDKLETLRLPGSALSNMRVDGAFRLAEHTGDLRDLAFAEALQAKEIATRRTPERSRDSGAKGEKSSSFSGIRWDDGISEWVAATPATDLPRRRLRGPKETSRTRDRGSDSDSEESSEGGSEGGSEGDTDISNTSSPLSGTDRVCYGSPGDTDNTSDDNDDNASVTSETHDSTASPNAAASPLTPFSEPEPGPELDPSPSPGPTRQEHGKGQPAAARHDSNGNNGSSPPRPPPGDRFLKAKPRRLSRPLAMTRGCDELALDYHSSHCNDNNSTNQSYEGRTKWLCRKKPAQFRLAASATVSTRRASARASLVYLQPRQAERRTAAVGGYSDDSDDELSIL